MTLYRFDTDNRHLIPYRSAPWGETYTEQDLEDWLERNPAVVTEGEPILIIARQPSTPFSGTPDLIGLDTDGNTVVIELKRGRTPRDVVAQALEYAAWLDGLDQERIVELANIYLAQQNPGQTLAHAWRDAFAFEEEETDTNPGDPPALPAGLRLNERQRLILVLEGADERTTHVVQYLRKLSVDIGLAEYRFYRIESGEEVLDIRVRTGQERATTTAATDIVSEEKVMAGWPDAAREPYRAFRDTFLARDPQVTAEPRKSSISFYKQSRDGRVFLGSYGGSQQHVTYWFRKDSLQDRIDLQAAIAGLKARTPRPIIFTDEWDNDCSFRIPFSAQHTGHVAELVAEEIAGRLE